ALQVRRVAAIDSLNRAGRSAAAARHSSLRRGFVSAPSALAGAVVFRAPPLARGFLALPPVDPGFLTADTLAVNLTLRGSRYAAAVRQREFFAGIEASVASIPGVIS